MSSGKVTTKGLSKRHWKFIIIENALGPMFTNVAINGGITWLVFRSFEGETIDVLSTKMDILSTSFLLPFITVLLANVVVGKQVRSKKLDKLLFKNGDKKLGVSRNVWLRASLLGVIAVTIIGFPTVWLMNSNGEGIQFISYVCFKGIWAGVFALIVSPIAGWWALQKQSLVAQ
jgi:hypothetical protein